MLPLQLGCMAEFVPGEAEFPAYPAQHPQGQTANATASEASQRDPAGCCAETSKPHRFMLVLLIRDSLR